MTGPQDPAAAGGDRLRAGHADREQVIDTLKTAFVHGPWLIPGTNSARGSARRSPPGPTPTWPRSPPTSRPPPPPQPRPGRRARPARHAAGRWSGRPPGRAAAWSSRPLLCGAPDILDPGTPPQVPIMAGFPCRLLIALSAVLAALGFLIAGMSTSLKQRRSRGQLPPRPGPGGHALDGGRRGGTGHGPVAPDPAPATPAPTCGLTSHGSTGTAHPPSGPAPRGARPAPGAV